MLNSEKKPNYSNSRVVRIKNSERNKKPYPPFKLNGRSLTHDSCQFVNSDFSRCKIKTLLCDKRG